MRFVFGLDGGGTSSRLRIADLDNQTIARESGEAVNPNAVQPDLLADRIESVFQRAFAQASIRSAADFAAGCVAVAGMDRPAEKAQFELLVRERLGFSCPVALVSDPDAALVGGLGSLEGVILIAGTGSIAVARLADGYRFRAGGYGHFLSDEGSAFFIGFQAMRRCLRSVEGRDLPTGMAEELVHQLGLSTPGDLVPFLYRRFDKAAIADASRLVARYRDEGDELALDIYRESARELSVLVESVVRAAGVGLTRRDLLLWGGLFDHDPWLKETVMREIELRALDLRVCSARNDAAYGACMIAIERAREP